MTKPNIGAKGIAMVFLAFTLAACERSQPVHLARLERVVFDTPTAELREELSRRRAEFDTPLLNIDPDDGQYMQMLADFAADPGMRYVYGKVDSLYGDLQWLEKELGQALARTDAVHYDGFYTLVSGDFEDYSHRVFCSDHELAISLDHYAVGELHVGVPAYIVRLCQRQYIAGDCMAAIARAHIAAPEGEPTLLDYAVAEGKVLYFLEQTLPSTHDTILLRYSGDQLRWMQKNVEQVWGWLIENRMLYSHDYGQYHNLVDEAPKTNAFGEGSAPRTLAYIGWQIVKQYMKKSNISTEELFAQTDSRKILTQSGWRP